jgi:hypothetical protein
VECLSGPQGYNIGLTHKYYTRLVILGVEKRSSLLCLSVIVEEKELKALTSQLNKFCARFPPLPKFFFAKASVYDVTQHITQMNYL